MSKAGVLISMLLLSIIGALLVGCGQEAPPEPTIVRLPTSTPTPSISAPTSTSAPTGTATPIPPTSTPTSTATPGSVPATSSPRSQSPAPTTAPGLEGYFVFQVASGGDIYTVNADGSNLTRLTDGMDPSWSPDGRQITFSRWRTPWGIYTINADGSSERLLFSSNVARTPIWSPDGSQIAFYFETQGFSAPWTECIEGYGCMTIIPAQLQTEWHLGVVDVADGYLRQPYNDRFSFAPTWSADGEWILYDGDHGLSMTTVEGPNNRVFTENVHDHFPVWSPDGSRIAFMHWQHDHWEIYLMNADGSGRWPLTSSSALLERRPNNVSPSWSPDGREIVFVSDRGGEWEFYVMNADGSEQRKILEGVTERLNIRYDGVNERVISWAR